MASTLIYEPFSATSLEARAGKILIDLEISMLCAGFEYLCIAITEAYREPDITEYVTKALVPRVSKRCGEKFTSVHRAMIRAVEHIRKHPNKEAIAKYLGGKALEINIITVVNAVSDYLRREDERKNA